MNLEKIQVLLVDDDHGDARLTQVALSGIRFPCFEVQSAMSLDEADEMVRSRQFDVMLLDLGLSRSHGLETLTLAKDCIKHLPIVVLTGLDDEETALQSLDEGAQDYLSKGDVSPATLGRAIRYAIQRHRMLGELTIANNELERKNKRLAELYETAHTFVDNVSHEFRTPLTVIKEFTSIVRDGLDGAINERQADRLDKVMMRTDDLGLMVDDMLDISKHEAGLLSVWRRPVTVNDILEEVMTVLSRRAEAKSVELSLSIEANLPEVFCDDEKARRVVINLAVNAIKFTPSGGRVGIWARVSSASGEVEIGVTDTGPGICEENLAEIFERFKQGETNIHTSTKGFGLGLNIANELVHLNLGDMNVESELSQGSTFSFTLPVNDIDSLINRYLNRLESWGQRQTQVSVLVGSIQKIGDMDVTPVVDAFLQQVLRSYDLVYQTSDGKWLLLTSCSEVELEELKDRVEGEWERYIRNYPHGDLPQIDLFDHGSWHAIDQGENLLDVISSLFDKQASGSSGSKTVLIVDDDEEVAAGLRIRLEAAGYEVLTKHDGQQGLDCAKQKIPDAILMDIRMPVMDGVTTLSELKSCEETKHIPIIMLSASIRDHQRALDEGATLFVQKPYNFVNLLSALETSLEPVTK